MEEHADLLARLYAGFVQSSAHLLNVKYLSTVVPHMLFIVIGINMSKDVPSSHPVSLCYLCCHTITSYKKTLDSGKPYKVCTVVFDGWTLHSDNECRLCEHGKKCIQGEGDQRR